MPSPCGGMAAEALGRAGVVVVGGEEEEEEEEE